MANQRIEEIKIIQHNVLVWNYNRKNALTNIYLKENPDIILLNSTGIRNEDKIKIYNYNIYTKNTLNEQNAGVAIAVRKNINHKIFDNYNSDILTIQINTTRGPVNITTIYQPPRRPFLPNADLSPLMHSNIPTYIIGDMNARHPFIGHTRSNAIGTALNQHINTGLITHLGPFFNTMTNSMHRNHISRPDIILRNQRAHFNYAINIGPITPSDHIPIIFRIATKPIIKEILNTPNTKKTNWENFKTTMHNKIEIQNRDINLEQHQRITQETINTATEKWLNDIENTVKECSPSKKIIYYRHTPDSDYMKLLIYQYEHYKNNYQIWNRNILIMIRSIQEEINKEANRMENEKWENDVMKLNDKHKNDPIRFWEGIEKMLGKERPNIPYLIGPNGEKIEEEDDQIRLLTNTWGKTFKISDEENRDFDANNEELVNNFINNNRERITPYVNPDLSRLSEDNYLISEITMEEIINTLKSFKNRAPGKSGITKLILTKIPPNAWQRFKTILNLSLSMGFYTIPFKEGALLLPPKPGKDPKLPENRRPITLLEVPGKIWEKIINSRLRLYLEEKDKYYKHQHGFRQNRSTETALAIIYETIALNQLNKKHQCNIVCRDISRAFDKTWHNALKYKILHLELPLLYEKLLSSYIDNRKVNIRKENGTYGDTINIESGVPQGGILSPTLFILYTADLPETPHNVLNIAYADDITQIIIYPGKSKQMLAINTRREIERINEYEKKWKIKTNKNKFQLLSISKSKPPEIRINNERINYKEHVNILGLNIKRTGISVHIRQKLAQARIRKGKLKRFDKLTPKIKMHLYKSLTRPVFEYPNTPMCIMSNTNQSKIQSFQNANITQIHNRQNNNNNNNRQTTEQLHNTYKVDTINTRMHTRAIKTWEKIKELNPELTTRSENININETPDHYWWPRLGKYINQPPPQPKYN